MNNSLKLTVKIIQSLLESYHHNISQQSYSIDEKNIKYILNQTLRQIWLPREKMYITEKADALWQSISNKDKFDCYYKDLVTIERIDSIPLSLYKGNEKAPFDNKIFYRNKTFSFRQVFHDDHIIPLKFFVDKLTKIEVPNEENILEIITLISICRMLKEEDRAIPNKSNRIFDEKKTIVEL